MGNTSDCRTALPYRGILFWVTLRRYVPEALRINPLLFGILVLGVPGAKGYLSLFLCVDTFWYETGMATGGVARPVFFYCSRVRHVGFFGC